MNQQNSTQLAQKEGRILLALSALNSSQFSSVRQAAMTFDVPESTLRSRRAGITTRRDCEPNSKKLTKTEESVIVQYILELNSRGFPPKLQAVRDMANQLLTARGASVVGEKWLTNFVRRTAELKSRFNRKYDYRRALCEDPRAMSKWFELIQRTIEAHGIAEEDIYNFDETGFQMGVIATSKVVTGLERRSQPKAI